MAKLEVSRRRRFYHFFAHISADLTAGETSITLTQALRGAIFAASERQLG
jgi:hypothetical protein